MRLLVIDDGSPTPVRAERVESVESTTIRLECNEGIERALNVGLRYAASLSGVKFIARIDAGDTMAPGRLGRQRQRFQDNPSLVVVGAGARFVEAESGRFMYSIRPPLTHEQIVKGMFRNSMIIHSAAMFSLSAAQEIGGYPLDFPANEDHEFFWRLVDRGQAENLSGVEIEVAVSPHSISVRRRRRQLLSGIKIVRARFRRSPVRAMYGIGRRTVFLVTPVQLLTSLKRIRSRDAVVS